MSLTTVTENVPGLEESGQPNLPIEPIEGCSGKTTGPLFRLTSRRRSWVFPKPMPRASGGGSLCWLGLGHRFGQI